MDFLRQSDEILSVGEFSRRFKMLVKTQVPELWLRGEISNLKTQSSGHVYFTLKDSDASISAALFKGYARMLSFPLREGMKILAYGEISIYEPRGSYQLVIKAAMPDGDGDLSKRYELLKQKLSDEGLFDKSRKKTIPKMPRNIAVITSPTGAAIRDFCRILIRRAWRGNIFILPARVQGGEAAFEIVKQLQYAQTSEHNFDLVVLTRGGGSLEDLWCFNEEIVARSIADSKIPTISAVGHEIDFTLSDFASDLRAETPSAAAEYISSYFIDCANSVRRNFELISQNVKFKITQAESALRRADDILRLNSPSSKLATANMRTDELTNRLASLSRAIVADRLGELRHLTLKLKTSPAVANIELLNAQLQACAKRLKTLSVDNIFARGFSIIRDENGAIVSSATQVNSGDNISITLAKGGVSAKII